MKIKLMVLALSLACGATLAGGMPCVPVFTLGKFGVPDIINLERIFNKYKSTVAFENNLYSRMSDYSRELHIC